MTKRDQDALPSLESTGKEVFVIITKSLYSSDQIKSNNKNICRNG